MAAIAVVGIVDQDHVAGIELPLNLLITYSTDSLPPRYCTEVRWAPHRASGAVPHADGDIVQLGDQRILRGAVDHMAHFFTDALKRMPHGGKSHPT